MDAEKAFWLFAAFTAIVFLMGGGSRHDIESLGPLRAVSAVLLALALFFQTSSSIKRILPVLAILVPLAVWMIIQLVPLPPAIWTALPGREAIADVDALVGLQQNWRPITLSPLKTANSLASLVVPMAGLMLLALLDDKGWHRMNWVVILAGLASALFGIAQVFLTDGGGLYLYEITNQGSAVGLFSNRNHNAIFLCVALLFCVFQFERLEWPVVGRTDLVLIVVSLLIFAAIILNSSRAGIAGLGVVGAIFAVRSFVAWRKQGKSGRMRFIGAAMIGFLSVSLFALFTVFGGSPAVERILAQDATADQRVQSLPYVLELLANFQPFGAGFGAFEQAFRMVEPDELLRPRYLNQAHNDWLQWPLEGGVPAILILAFCIFLILRRSVRLLRAPDGSQEMVNNAQLGMYVVLIFALGSLVDYPLRTPSLMLVGVIALVMLFKPLAVGAKG